MPVCGRCAEDNPARARFCLACAAPLVEPAARDERKIVSVLFCDLVGFTSRAEHLDAEDMRGLAAATPDPSSWLLAATAVAAGDFQRAADHYARIGSLPDEAVARLRAAEYLLAAGQATAAKAQLRRASAFFARVRADAYLREAEALLAVRG